MKFTVQQYAQGLYESLHETNPKDHDKVIENFIHVLKRNGDLDKYEKTIEAFERYDREQRGIKEVEVTTARPLEANRNLIHRLNEIVGTDIELKQKVDERLVGGIVVKVDDTMIDGSVKSQLKNLHNKLIN